MMLIITDKVQEDMLMGKDMCCLRSDKDTKNMTGYGAQEIFVTGVEDHYQSRRKTVALMEMVAMNCVSRMDQGEL